MLNYSEKFWVFYNELTKLDFKFSIKYKNESLFMKILGTIMFFNPSFMTGFITTIGKTVYFPNKEYLNNLNSSHYIGTLAHEFRHTYDNKKWNLIFPIIYMLPQLLALFSLLSILAIWFGFVWLFCLLFLLFLLPIPSPGRRLIELNGYTMSLFMSNEFMKESESADYRKKILSTQANHYNDNFIGAAYYFMWPLGIKKQLDNNIEKIISGEIIKEDVIYNQMILAYAKTK